MTSTLTRADLADAIYRKLGLSHTESSEIIDSIIEESIEALVRNEDLKVSSFGTFHVRKKKQRMGRNPKTKKEIPISARKVVSFHSSNILTKRINP